MLRMMEPVTTTCYGTTEKWERREDAMRFYMKCVRNSEGHERLRYENVVFDLLDGLEHATDHMEHLRRKAN